MKNTIYHAAGPMALGSRIRQTSERLTQEAAKVYKMYGVNFEPRWFPVVYALLSAETLSVAELAEKIGQSQAAISQIIKQMAKAGVLDITKSVHDGRKTLVTLSEKGRADLPALQEQFADVGQAVDELLAQTEHNLWKALDELDSLLEKTSLSERVSQQRKRRESAQVQIVPFSSQYRAAFRSLNEQWISQYFVMEEPDYQALDHPEKKILEPGGRILMALLGGEVVGTCALVKMDETTYELAKMAVAPQAQGRHVGWMLGQSILEKARELGAKRVYLESNTILKPAINLYRKLGFQQIQGATSPYQRSNIQMELWLD